MTDDNCAVVNCGTNRRTKGIGIFKLPSKKLHPERRKEWVNEITKTRTVDALYTPVSNILQKKMLRSVIFKFFFGL